MKHKIMKQDPKNLIFDVMSVERINDLYSSKKRK